MFSQSFRLDSSRLRAVFAPRKPRNPLLRVVLGLVGLAVLCVLVFFGLFVGAAMIGSTMLLRLFTQRGRHPGGPRVVDAQYHVVRKQIGQ